MTFDLIVSNPPYNMGLHLKIHRALQTCLRPGGAISFVHPAQYLLTHKGGKGICKGQDIDLSKLERVHLLWGNAMFNIQLFMPICVSTWRKGKVGTDVAVRDDAYTHSSYVCPCDEINQHGGEFRRFRKWLDENVPIADRLVDHGDTKPSGPIHIMLSTYRGHPPVDGTDEPHVKDDFYTILPKSKIEDHFVFHEFPSNDKRVFTFPSEQERANFIVYLKTKCVRFVLSLFKTNQQLTRGEMNRIPWMDFTRSWYDEDLRKEWNIDDDLWAYIDKFIPDYYTDYSFCRIM